MRFKCKTLARPKRASKDLRRINPTLKLSAAQQTTAFVYGYKDWHELQAVTARHDGEPSLDDEKLDADALAKRRTYQADRLAEATAMDKNTAVQIIDIWRPTAQQPLSATIEQLGGDAVGDGEEEEPLVRPMTAEDMEEGMASFAKAVLGHDVDPTELMEAMREGMDYDYGLWWDILTHLGWTLADWNKAPERCHPCFTAFSRRLGRKVPVITERITFNPDDTEDVAAQHIFATVAQKFPRGAIVMFRYLLTTDVDGKTYTYGGQLYHQGRWHPFALSQGVKGVDDLLQQLDEGFTFDRPLPKYEDEHGGILARTVSLHRQGFSGEDEAPKMMGLRMGRWVQWMA